MIAFDSNVLIYYIEGSPEFGAKATEVIRQAENNGASVSVLIVAEVIAGAKQPVDILLDFFDDSKKLGNIKVVDISYKIAVHAGEIRKKQKSLSLADAIHLASAMDSGADTFYTNDHVLTKLGVINSMKIKSLT